MNKKISELTTAATLSGAELAEVVQSGSNKKITKQQELASTFAVTASGTNTYTATFSPVITAYTTNHRYFIKFTNANTAASTLNIDSLGAKDIKKSGTVALASGDISAGQILELIYDGTNFQIIGGVVGSGGTTSSGIYTPTLTNIANTSARTAYSCVWMRVGSTVMVAGSVDLTVTAAATFTEISFTLPVSSNFASNVNGAGTASNGSDHHAYFYAQNSTDTMNLTFISTSTGIDTFRFMFSYEVI